MEFGIKNRAKILILAVAAVVVVGVAAGLWWYFNARGAEEISTKLPAPIAERVVAEGVAGESVREYKNDAYRFALQYPQSLGVKEYDEAGGALSVTFQSAFGDEEFQIYITPYEDTQITNARFRLDIPSGVMKEPVDVIIDGVRATMFWSKNTIMGETREVWFIRDGFLYEVVTYKEFDTWLAKIMKTWKFTP